MINVEFQEYLLTTVPSFSCSETDCQKEDALLNWCKQCNFFNLPSVRIIELNNIAIFRTTVEIKSDHNSSKILGCGRDSNPKTSLVKAYVEAIERLVFVNIHRSKLEHSNYLLSIANGEFDLSTENHKMPPRSLMTSNGWAAHFDYKKSVLNSYQEAIERHLLLQSYFKNGWDGFLSSQSEIDNQWSVNSLVSQYSINNYKAGVVAVQSRTHPGKTFGHFASINDEILNSPRWIHALHESIEPAILFDRMSNIELLNLKLESTDWLEKNQITALLLPSLIPTENAQIILRSKYEFHTGNLLIIDISKALNLPVALYCSYFYSDWLIPLFSKLNVKSNAQSYLCSVLNKYGMNYEDIPDFHPFV